MSHPLSNASRCLHANDRQQEWQRSLHMFFAGLRFGSMRSVPQKEHLLGNGMSHVAAVDTLCATDGSDEMTDEISLQASLADFAPMGQSSFTWPTLPQHQQG